MHVTVEGDIEQLLVQTKERRERRGRKGEEREERRERRGGNGGYMRMQGWGSVLNLKPSLRW